MIFPTLGLAALVVLQPAPADADADAVSDTYADVGIAVEDDSTTSAYDDVDVASLTRIFVRDSQEATEVEVVHPLQPICMRKILPGSRVKARTLCQDKTSWIAYRTSLDAMTDAWGNSAIPLEPGGDPTPGKSFGQGR